MPETRRSRTYHLPAENLRVLASFTERAPRGDALVEVNLTPAQEEFLRDAWEALRLRPTTTKDLA